MRDGGHAGIAGARASRWWQVMQANLSGEQLGRRHLADRGAVEHKRDSVAGLIGLERLVSRDGGRPGWLAVDLDPLVYQVDDPLPGDATSGVNPRLVALIAEQRSIGHLNH